jgi:DNA helicase HerA-like ATPase
VKVFKEQLLKYWRIPFPLSIAHPLGRTFSSLTTPLTTEELSLLANFPRREIPGIKVLPMADFSMNPPKSNGFKLGNILDGGETVENLHYRIDLSVLNKHVLIAGITGSGKTTTCTQLLQELLDEDEDKRIPFLIIEPAKSEYVDWARDQNRRGKKIAIYAPGSKDSEEKLVLNPFDYVSQDYVLSHIDRLKAILSAVFPMQEVLPIILENLLIKAYIEKKCIDAEEKPSDIPDIACLLEILGRTVSFNADVIDPSYDNKIKGDITACLRTRLKSLQIGWKKDLFAKKTTDWKKLFDRPVVINLSQLGDNNDKALVVSILLLFLHEYRQIQHKQNQSSKSNLRHVTVLEEAHCILQKTSEVNFEHANPKGKVAEMFSDMLSEIRAYGEGMVIIDQVPSRLIPDAIKNTNLKILHRIVSADDREAMSACMSLTPEQSKIIGILRPGQAIVHGDLDDMASWVEIENPKSWAI